MATAGLEAAEKEVGSWATAPTVLAAREAAQTAKGDLAVASPVEAEPAVALLATAIAGLAAVVPGAQASVAGVTTGEAAQAPVVAVGKARGVVEREEMEVVALATAMGAVVVADVEVEKAQEDLETEVVEVAAAAKAERAERVVVR